MGFRLEKKMIDLALSGLPLQWDGHNRKLVFGQGMDQIDPALRTMEEMSNVLFERENAFGQGGFRNPALLYVPDLHLEEHRLLSGKKGYAMMSPYLYPAHWEKNIKTAGHYHPLNRERTARIPKYTRFCRESSLSYAEASRL